MTRLLQSKEFWLFSISVLLLGIVCKDGLVWLLEQWKEPDYSHGYMIPAVCVYMLWQRRDEIAPHIGQGGYLGVLLLVFALLLWLLGEGSALLALTQYAFLFGIFALSVLWLGIRGTLLIWAPLAYLFFMIPLPDFFYNSLSNNLQLISSALGVAIVRLFGISVFLEGNIIDLGVYQLQVVEACSGLRYLFPLVSFGFLIAYIYKGPVWQRLLIFFSTVPITVLMNSVRIGVIGVTVEYFGIAAAEGVLHDFEGWVVFMACLAALTFEIWVIYLFSRKDGGFLDLFDFEFGRKNNPAIEIDACPPINTPVWAAMLVLLVAVPMSFYFVGKQDSIPARESFASFPLLHKGWVGRENMVEPPILEKLQLTDYFLADFHHNSFNGPLKNVEEEAQSSIHTLPVNLYMAYYDSQRKASSVHSPRSCIPGDGWDITDISQVSFKLSSADEFYAGNDVAGEMLFVNRVVIEKGETRQLVYYWFQQRGRIITNEYMAKWYIFWDSLTRSRTDGALVRAVIPLPDDFEVADVEFQLRSFITAFYPLVSEYVPD